MAAEGPFPRRGARGTRCPSASVCAHCTGRTPGHCCCRSRSCRRAPLELCARPASGLAFRCRETRPGDAKPSSVPLDASHLRMRLRIGLVRRAHRVTRSPRNTRASPHGPRRDSPAASGAWPLGPFPVQSHPLAAVCSPLVAVSVRHACLVPSSRCRCNRTSTRKHPGRDPGVLLRELDSNQRPTGYEPVELPLLHPATSVYH